MILPFIKNWKTSGAIMPTGKKVTEEVTRFITGEKECIVEIGPGTGVFTKKILEKSPHSTTICIEINKDFVDIMQRDYPAAHTYHDDATQLGKYITKHSYEKCNKVVSGLPWASFHETLQKEILTKLYISLEKDGIFSTFAYIGIHKMPKGKSFYRLLCEIFGSENIQISRTYFSNMPPAFVYHCTKK